MSYPVLGAKKAYTTSNAYTIIFIFDVYAALTCEQRAGMRSNHSKPVGEVYFVALHSLI